MFFYAKKKNVKPIKMYNQYNFYNLQIKSLNTYYAKLFHMKCIDALYKQIIFSLLFTKP